MKASTLRTLYIMLMTGLYFGYYCLAAIIKNSYSSVSPAWVNQSVNTISNKLLHLIRVKCVIVNQKNIQPQPGVPTIMMCNHSSLYDIPLSYKIFPNHTMRMLAKKEMAKIPFLGRAMKACGYIFIDRKNKLQAIQDLNEARLQMQGGVVLWMAPEGTRSKTGKLMPFKKGGFITAIQAGATIIPIGIRGAHEILPSKSLCVNLYQTAEIHIGEPIDASQYAMENKDELIARTYHSIQDLLGP